MEKYLFIFRGGMNNSTASPESLQQNMQKWMTWMESLAKKGTLVGGEPLKTEGKTVSGNSKLVKDGPFIEGKEVVGGYLLINATSLDDAVEISKDCPIYENDGIVEVRPIQEMTM